MVAEMIYTVEATRSGSWWSLQCREVPGALSQSKSLAEAKKIMPEAIAFVADVPEAEIEVTVVPIVPNAAHEHLQEAARLRGIVAAANSQAAAESRQAAQELRKMGMTVRDIGETLGVSYQRASQLLASAS